MCMRVNIFFAVKCAILEQNNTHQSTRISHNPSSNTIAGCGLLGSCGGDCICLRLAGRSGQIRDIHVQLFRLWRSKYEENGDIDHTTPPGELALALGVDGSTAARGEVHC